MCHLCVRCWETLMNKADIPALKQSCFVASATYIPLQHDANFLRTFFFPTMQSVRLL